MSNQNDDWDFDPYLDARLSQDPAKRRPEHWKRDRTWRKRTERLPVWISHEERALILRACGAAGQRQSDWVRRALRLAALAELHRAAHRKDGDESRHTSRHNGGNGEPSE